MKATRADLAKIHIAKKELVLSDDAYRDILRLCCSKDSAAKITHAQANAVLDHFRTLGWQPKRQGNVPGKYSRPKDRQDKKIIALWITLYKNGVIKNNSDKALQAFVKRMSKKDNLRWCSASEKNMIIEALKDWAFRKGVDVV